MTFLTRMRVPRPRVQPDTLARLVMVATSAWYPRLPSTRSWTETTGEPTPHQLFLDRVLTGAKPGHVWLCRDPDGGDVEYRRDGAGRALAAGIAHDVQQTCLKARDAKDRARARAELEKLRHRFYLDPTGFRALADSLGVREDRLPPPGMPFHVALDAQFDMFSDPVCYLSVTVWSGLPFDVRFRPAALKPGPGTGFDHFAPAGYRAAYAEIDKVVTETLLPAYFRPAEFSVFAQPYALPLFWVAIPQRIPTHPNEYVDRRRHLTDLLARQLLDLGTAEDSAAEGGLLNGQFLVLRRFDREHPRTSAERARYLIIPGPVPPGYNHRAYQPYGDTAPAEAARQENLAAEVVSALARLEVCAADTIRDVRADLAVWESHLAVYHAVAARAGLLWDALSTHLPVRRGPRLDRVHRAVELLHQILLQGIADLADLSTLTQHCVARIDDAADDLLTGYDTTFTERRLDQSSLRAALTRTRLIERARVNGQKVLREAERVKAGYDDLLAAIGRAFDERRARESDALQKIGLAVSALFGLIGVVTVLDAVLQMKPADTDNVHPVILLWPGRWQARAGIYASLAAGLAVVFGSVYYYLQSFRLDRLGSRWFRRRYGGHRWRPQLWCFLKDCSTDRLEEFERHKAKPTPAEWDALDRDLAGRFARLWDDAARPPRTRRSDRAGTDIRALARRIEEWGLHALLLTERPRRMSRYRLPRLACLYRCCAGLPTSFLAVHDDPAALRLMATNEFRAVLRRARFTDDQATRMDTWLHASAPRSARHVLHLLDGVGLTADMRPADITALVDQLETTTSVFAVGVTTYARAVERALDLPGRAGRYRYDLRDDGVDIEVPGVDGQPCRLVRARRTVRPVGRAALRDLRAEMRGRGITAGTLVSTAGFDATCVRAARRAGDVTLVDGAELDRRLARVPDNDLRVCVPG